MILIYALLVFSVLVTISIGVLYLKTLAARLRVESTVQIQCGSGDSEVMVVNLNRYRGESKSDLQSRMADSWELIQDRRSENHRKWLQIQEESRAEKEAAQKIAQDSIRSIKKGE